MGHCGTNKAELGGRTCADGDGGSKRHRRASGVCVYAGEGGFYKCLHQRERVRLSIGLTGDRLYLITLNHAPTPSHTHIQPSTPACMTVFTCLHGKFCIHSTKGSRWNLAIVSRA